MTDFRIIYFVREGGHLVGTVFCKCFAGCLYSYITIIERFYPRIARSQHQFRVYPVVYPYSCKALLPVSYYIFSPPLVFSMQALFFINVERTKSSPPSNRVIIFYTGILSKTVVGKNQYQYCTNYYFFHSSKLLKGSVLLLFLLRRFTKFIKKINFSVLRYIAVIFYSPLPLIVGVKCEFTRQHKFSKKVMCIKGVEVRPQPLS